MTEVGEPTMLAWGWGLAAFIVFCVFPGYMARKKFHSLTWVESLALSIGSNASLVLLLNFVGLYNRRTICTYVLAALGLLFYAMMRDVRKWRFHWAGERLWPWLVIAPILLLVFYLTFFFPFVQWDAVASWNRWAVTFTQEPDYLMGHRWFYPQFLSFSYSFIYKAAGDTNIVQLVHGLSFIHVILLVGAVEELSRQVGIKTCVAMGLVFISTPFAQHVSSGYADIPSAAFAAVSVAALIRANENGRKRKFLGRCIFAGWLCAVAVLHKQLGAVPFVMIPLLWPLTASKDLRKIRLIGATAFLIAGIISLLPWTLRLGDWFGSYIIFLTQDIYGGATRAVRVLQACKTLLRESSIVLFPSVNTGISLVACALAFLALFTHPRTRICVITALAATIAYIFFFSYDTRALMAAIPLCCIGIAAGGEALFVQLFKPSEKRLRRMGYATSLLLALLATAYQIRGAWERTNYFQYVATSAAFTVPPWASNQEKQALFIDGYMDLIAWEKAYPLKAPFQYWLTDPRLCAIAQKGKSKRFDGYLEHLLKQKPTKQEWKNGDVLLIGKKDISLRAFIDRHVEEGWITRLDKIGFFTGYVVHEIHNLPEPTSAASNL